MIPSILFFFLILLFPWGYLYGQNPYDYGPNTVVLGCLLPLSGEYETVGKRALRGVLTATDVFSSGGRVRIIVKDTGGGTWDIRKSLEEMVREDGVSLVIGPIPSTSIDEIRGDIESLRIPTLVFPLSEGVPLGNPYIIGFSYSIERQADVLARYAVQEIRIKDFAILHPRTRLGELFKEAFAKSVKRLGGNITYTGSYDSKLTDITMEVEWIRAAHPEAIFIPDGATRSGELIMRLKNRLPPGNTIFLGPNTWNSPAFLRTVGGEADGVIFKVLFTDFFFPDSRRWVDFSSGFKSAFKEEPGFLEYQVYEAVRLILGALRPPIERREEVMERLLHGNNRDFDITRGLNGGLEIAPKPFILTVEDGRIRKIR